MASGGKKKIITDVRGFDLKTGLGPVRNKRRPSITSIKHDGKGMVVIACDDRSRTLATWDEMLHRALAVMESDAHDGHMEHQDMVEDAIVAAVEAKRHLRPDWKPPRSVEMLMHSIYNRRSVVVP